MVEVIQNFYSVHEYSHNVYIVLGLRSVMPSAQKFASVVLQTRAKLCSSCNRDSYGRGW